MSTPNRIGVQNGPFLQTVEENENQRTGSEVMTHWVGAESEVDAQRNLIRSQGATKIMKRNMGDGNWELTAEFPFNSNGIEVYPLAGIHELDVSVLQPEIWENPLLVGQCTSQGVAIVRKVLTDYEQGKYPRDAESTALEDALADLRKQREDASIGVGPVEFCLNCFIMVVCRGTTNYIDYQNVYRRTLTAATAQIVQASYIGKGKIWTSAEVMNYEGLPVDGWFQLDPEMQWLKSRPQVCAATGQKTQIVYSYTECKQATGLLYEAYGAAVLVDLTPSGF